MWSALGTVVTPSHVVSQVVAFPTDALIVFPGQGKHKSPFLKYPAWQTGKNRNIGRIFRTKEFIIRTVCFEEENFLLWSTG